MAADGGGKQRDPRPARREVRRRFATVLGAALLAALTSSAVAGTAWARTARPTIVGFSASSPAVASGADVTLSATVTGATRCTFSSKRPVAGLPLTTACGQGTITDVVVMPVNTGKRPVTETFTLSATGPGGTRRSPPVKVTVARGVAAPPPIGSTQPPASTPETPAVLALPAAATLAFGGVWLFSRRSRRLRAS